VSEARSGHRRWRPWIPALVGLLAIVFAALAPVAARPVAASYQATADSNETAFEPPCMGWDDPHPERMLALATSGLAALGYDVKGYKGSAFTRAHVLSRTVGDWSYYVHSHGDYYWHPGDQRRYSGFREDSGDCVQSVVYSKDIKAKRDGRASNLVVISTCENGDANTTMPGAFGITKSKAKELDWNGPEFYLGYLGEAFDNDEETFEVAFWSALKKGKGVGPAFDLAMLEDFTHSSFDADWWGSYVWSGRAGPGGTCPSCV
jgi:hypothetical protein